MNDIQEQVEASYVHTSANYMTFHCGLSKLTCVHTCAVRSPFKQLQNDNKAEQFVDI